MKLKFKNPEKAIGITLLIYCLLRIALLLFLLVSDFNKKENLIDSIYFLLETYLFETFLLFLEFSSIVLFIQKKKLGWIGATFFSFKNAFFLIIMYWQFAFMDSHVEQPPLYGLIFYSFIIILNLLMGFTLLHKNIRLKYQPSTFSLIAITFGIFTYSAYKIISTLINHYYFPIL